MRNKVSKRIRRIAYVYYYTKDEHPSVTYRKLKNRYAKSNSIDRQKLLSPVQTHLAEYISNTERRKSIL